MTHVDQYEAKKIEKGRTKVKLNRKFTKGLRPSQKELERRGIVPEGAFQDTNQAMAKKKHARKTSVEYLTKKLGFDPKQLKSIKKGDITNNNNNNNNNHKYGKQGQYLGNEGGVSPSPGRTPGI